MMIHFEPPFFLLIATLACLWFWWQWWWWHWCWCSDAYVDEKKNLTPISSKKNSLMMAIMLTVMMIKENPFLLIMATLARLLINHRIWTDAATVGGRGGRRGALLILSVLPLSTLYLCSLMYLDVPFCTLVYFGACTLVLLQYHLPKAHSHLQKDGEGLSFRGATTSIPIAPHSKISCTISIPNVYPMYTHPMHAQCILYTTWKWVPLPYLTYNTVKRYTQ